jgi:hypothetical protein
VLKLNPKLDDNDLFLRLFHKGIKAQWSVDDVSWDDPLQFDAQQARSLARLLSPVYLGEQSAMIGASVALPQMAMAGQTSAQLYLSSFLMDEARHFEVLTRLYTRLDSEPLQIRELPAMLRYHNRLRQGDRIDWVWGILISDIFAKNFYQQFGRSQPEALFGKLSLRILQDESRHQAFAENYLKRMMSSLAPERVKVLQEMKDELMDIMDAMYGRLNDDALRLGMDGRQFLDDLRAEIEYKAKRIGLDGNLSDDDESGGKVRRVFQGLSDNVIQKASDLTSKFEALLPGRCDTCFVALLCQSRLLRTACS